MLEANEQFLGRVAGVAEELGIQYPFQENELRIRKFTFVNMLDDKYDLHYSEADQGTRAIVQLLVRNSHELDLDDEHILGQMEELFGDLWHEEVMTGRHKFIDLIKQSNRILIEFK